MKKFKKSLVTMLSVFLVLLFTQIAVLAYNSYYSSYEGLWVANPNKSINEEHIGINITKADNTSMDFEFFWYQFGVQIQDAKIDGATVYGKYYEVWDDGIDWDNYIIQGNITLTLGKNEINVSWVGKENGQPVSKELTLYKKDFISVYVNGTKVTFDRQPFIQDGRTLVPVRAIFEALGASVEWDSPFVTAKKGETIVFFGVGSQYNHYNKNYMRIYDGWDVPAQIINDRVFVPLRAVSEAFDCEVSWDGNTRTVNIWG